MYRFSTYGDSRQDYLMGSDRSFLLIFVLRISPYKCVVQSTCSNIGGGGVIGPTANLRQSTNLKRLSAGWILLALYNFFTTYCEFFLYLEELVLYILYLSDLLRLRTTQKCRFSAPLTCAVCIYCTHTCTYKKYHSILR